MRTADAGGSPRFTVALCTLNRAALLERALSALKRQTLSRSAFEVLVVDNGSTDDTRLVVDRFAADDAVRCVVEPRVGLSHARNRAYREARGEYVAYTDDDAVVPDSWLAVADRVVEAHAPPLFGGPYQALFDTPRPTWFDTAFGSYEPSAHAGVLPTDAYVPGANLFVRRDVVEDLGGFDPALGMRGSHLGFGEEVDLLHRVRARYGSSSIYYEPALRVMHRVDPRKLRALHFARVRFANGRDFGRHAGAGQEDPMGLLLLRVGWNAVRLGGVAIETTFRDRRSHPEAMSYAIRRALPRVWQLGQIYGAAQRRLGLGPP